MKSLFAHNIRIKTDKDNNLYTHSSYNANVWRRYKKISDQINIIGRRDRNIFDVHDAKSKFEKIPDNIGIVYVRDIYKSVLSFFNPWNHITNNRIISETVKQHDYIIARLPSNSGYKVIKYAKKNKIPYLCEVVACSWDGFWNHSLRGKAMAPFEFIKLKKAVKGAPYVVYVTNEFLQKRYPTGGKSINCSNVVLRNFDIEALNNRLKKIDTMDNNTKVVIGTTAAVDVKYKGQQYIIEALGKLKKEGIINYEYQLVGGGNQEYLKNIAKKNNVLSQVTFLDSLPHYKVFEWLENIDLYVQPSKQEGLPRALIEAMSKGVPAFGAKTAGIPELLEEQFLFSNKRTNIKEICKILKSFDKKLMIQQSIRNFEESKLYDEKLIDKRRAGFFNEFTSNIPKKSRY